MKSMTILWSPCTRMHYVPSHLTWYTLIYVCKHFLLCNRLQLGAGYTDLCSNIPGFCPGKSCNTFVPRNIKFIFSSFFFISVLLGYVQWRSGFKEHCTWTPWWSDSLPPNETLLLFCLWFPTRFLTQQTWFRNCISWEKKFVESWIWIKSPTIMDINFFRLFDTLTNFPFTTSETKSDYY